MTYPPLLFLTRSTILSPELINNSVSTISTQLPNDNNDANGKGPLLPSYDNVMKGTYQPLSRPLFIIEDLLQKE